MPKPLGDPVIAVKDKEVEDILNTTQGILIRTAIDSLRIEKDQMLNLKGPDALIAE